MDKQAASLKQNAFLKRIEDLLDSSTSLVHELSELLEVSTDSAYRRIRGETLLSIDEIILLCDTYNISFDAFSRAETELVTFAYKGLENHSGGLLAYLNDMLTDIRRIQAIPGSQIVYACQDIPVFYHYHHPGIAAFKFFYWMRSIMNIPDMDMKKYNPDLVDESIFEVARQIYECYARINSVEIWTDATIQSTLKQIGYYWDSGVFNTKEEALLVCESLKNEISSIQRQAEVSAKRTGDERESADLERNYLLYHSEIEITNNCVLVDLGVAKAVYLSHFSFYTMKTTNEDYCNKTRDWLNSLIKKTSLISGVSEKARFQFFNKMLKAIEDLERKIAEGS